MHHFSVSALLAYATVATACTLPTTPLSNTITTGFGILIQNPAFPVIHDRYMNLNPAGGGDKHLFLSPVPEPAFDLVLTQGAIAQGIIHAVIGGEYDEINNTTKMFMTERGDPKTIFQPTYACDPDTDEVQIELVFVQMERAPLGGDICVRIASGARGYEFRYSPPGNPSDDPTNPCIRVRMIVKAPGTVVTTPTSSPSTTSSVSSTTTSVSTSTTSPSVVGSSTTSSSTSSTTAPTGSSSTTSASATSTSTTSNAPTGPTHPATVSSIWNFQGCRTEATNMRALTGASFASDTMTLESCAAFCSGFNYFGTEYARECFCGNTFNPGSVPAPTLECNFLCKGNAQELCGAGLRLSIYAKGAVSVSQSSSSSASSSTSSSAGNTQTSSVSTTLATSTTSTSTGTATTTSSTSTGSTSPLPYTDMTSKGFAFVGCAPEERRATDGPGRTLTGALYAEDIMTDGKCVDFCLSKGYTYAGTEYSRECWCGNSVAPGRQPQTTVASLAACSNKCGGDTTQYCGGDSWLSLYKACPVGGACVNAVFT